MNVINPRFYVMTVEFSKASQSENRTQPKGFNSLNEAKASLYRTMSDDIRNENVAWAVGYLNDNFGNTIMHLEYIQDHYLDPDQEPEPVEPETPEEPVEEPTEG